jgi:NADH-quinone oxidoreductase subunit L
VTHAFFKSLLFLAAGVIILALNHEHDVFRMGGMARKSPFTFAVFLVGAFALAAIPPTTAGFSSKDHILLVAWQAGGSSRILGILGLVGVFFTSVYIFRLVFMVFGGAPRPSEHADGHDHGHAAGKDGRQSGAMMGVPLAVLAGLCLVGGFLGLPHDLGGSPYLLDFLGRVLPPDAAGEAPLRLEAGLQIASEAASLLGIPVAWLVARRARAKLLAGTMPAKAAVPVRFLLAGWGFDWLYDRAVIRPFTWIARINVRDVVDRLYDGIGGFFGLLSRMLRWTQNGRVRWYAAGAALGALLIVTAVVVL